MDWLALPDGFSAAVAIDNAQKRLRAWVVLFSRVKLC
jgi:hypothetical protein